MYSTKTHETCELSMLSPVEFPPDHIFLYKPIPGVQCGGCRALVWLPEIQTKDAPESGIDRGYRGTSAPLAL
jgi:hypothetical protein